MFRKTTDLHQPYSDTTKWFSIQMISCGLQTFVYLLSVFPCFIHYRVQSATGILTSFVTYNLYLKMKSNYLNQQFNFIYLPCTAWCETGLFSEIRQWGHLAYKSHHVFILLLKTRTCSIYFLTAYKTEHIVIDYNYHIVQ